MKVTVVVLQRRTGKESLPSHHLHLQSLGAPGRIGDGLAGAPVATSVTVVMPPPPPPGLVGVGPMTKVGFVMKDGGFGLPMPNELEHAA